MARSKPEKARYQREWISRNKDKVKAYRKAYWAKNREKLLSQAKASRTRHRDTKAAGTRRWDLKTRHGITLDDYDAMLREQSGLCAICGSAEPCRGRKFLYVDHCHKTGRIRGLLCLHCNTGLGHFKDNPEIMWRAINYLRGGAY